MQLSETGFEGLVILEPAVNTDERGYFIEAYNKKTLKRLGINLEFVQDNQSRSKYGVLRGLHYQNPPYAQSKLVRVLEGEILDVVVDIRPASATYLKNFTVVLSDVNKKQVLVPPGFAHGFIVLSKSADVIYKTDEYYNPDAEGGLLYNDPVLDINWKVPAGDIILSDKDINNPTVANADIRF